MPRPLGSKNKDKYCKQQIKSFSEAYLTEEEYTDENGVVCFASQFERDFNDMTPRDRVFAFLKLMKFHTPELKAIDVEMSEGMETNRRILAVLGDLTAGDSKE